MHTKMKIKAVCFIGKASANEKRGNWYLIKMGKRATVRGRERGNWNLVKITGKSVLIIRFQLLTRGYLLAVQSAFPPTKTNNIKGITLSP